jgi:hypothetical protein
VWFLFKADYGNYSELTQATELLKELLKVITPPRVHVFENIALVFWYLFTPFNSRLALILAKQLRKQGRQTCL